MTHHRELRESAYWLLALLAGLLLVRILPAPDAARGLASYLPLHTIMEMLSIAVAAMVFSIAWVTQKYRLNGRALVLGIGLLGVALLDLSHALSYAGMPDFITPSGPEKAINFWLAARAMAAARCCGRRCGPRAGVAGWTGGGVTSTCWPWAASSGLCTTCCWSIHRSFRAPSCPAAG